MKTSPATVNNGCRIILPENISDLNSKELLSDVRNSIKKSPAEIILDCSQLTQVVSSHINILWQIRLDCDKANISLKLESVPERLKRVLQILDLYELFVQESEEPVKLDQTEVTKGSIPENAKFKTVFTSSSEQIGQALLQFKKFLDNLALPQVFSFELETVFYEVATNIRLYGEVRKSDQIQFSIQPENNKLIMIFKYNGIHFDPTLYNYDFDPAETAKLRKKRGYGLTMIKRMTDSINYQRIGNSTNVLVLEKKLGNMP